MGLGCGMSLIKYVLFVFNLLCALCGIALLALGIVYLTDVKELDKVLDGGSATGPTIVLIVLGALIFIISFFGCCGAIRESHCMTFTYSIFLLILIVAQIVLGVFVLVKSDELKQAIQKGFDKLWENRTVPANKQFLDTFQTTLQCCGSSGPLSYLSPSLPDSCCAEKFLNSCTPLNSFSLGCREAFVDFTHQATMIIGWVVLGVAAVELIGFIFACCLANSIRNQERRYA